MKKIVLVALLISGSSLYCAEQSPENNTVLRIQNILADIYKDRSIATQKELEELSADFVNKLEKNPDARTLIDAAKISQCVTYSAAVPNVLKHGLSHAAQMKDLDALDHPDDTRTLGLILRAGRSATAQEITSQEIFELLDMLFAPKTYSTQHIVHSEHELPEAK